MYSLYHFSLYADVALVPVQYIYRFILIWFNKALGWLSFGIIVAVAVVGCAINSYRRFSEFIPIHETLHDNSVQELGWINAQTGKIFNYGAFSLATNNNYSYGILACSYIVIIFCALAVFIKIRVDVSELQHIDFKIYRQTSIILFLEAILPFIFIVVPVLFNLLAVSLKIQATWFSSLLTTMSVLNPLCNALTKLFVIGTFRKAILSYLPFITSKSVTVSVTIKSH